MRRARRRSSAAGCRGCGPSPVSRCSRASASRARSPCGSTSPQEHIPDRALSRVSSYDYLTSAGLIPLGNLLIGFVTVAIGLHSTLFGAWTILGVAGRGGRSSVPAGTLVPAEPSATAAPALQPAVAATRPRGGDSGQGARRGRSGRPTYQRRDDPGNRCPRNTSSTTGEGVHTADPKVPVDLPSTVRRSPKHAQEIFEADVALGVEEYGEENRACVRCSPPSSTRSRAETTPERQGAARPVGSITTAR